MNAKPVTYADIAKYTNFSKTTISRYFNNPDSVTAKNQEIIAHALIDLNYHRNKLASILANGNSEFVGIIIPNMFLHYYSEILNQILTSYEEYDYKFLVFLGDDDIEKEKKYIEELMAYQIEGLIILSHTIPSEDLAEYDIPIVTIEREDEHVNSVNTDNYSGGAQAARLLIENGCDLLVHANSCVNTKIPSYNRIRGFEDACKDAGIEYEIIIEDFGNSFETANANIVRLVENLEEKYAGRRIGLFLSNDTYANLALNQLFRKYGKLPDHFEIIGFDDSPIAKQSILPITTVGQQIEKIVQEAMSLLVEMMSERKNRKTPPPNKEIVHKEVTPKLIERETTSAFKTAGA